MIYSNLEFLLLFFITVSLYILIPLYQVRFGILLVSSLIFYSWSGVLDTLIFGSVIGVSWLATYFAVRFPRRKKIALVSGIVIMTLHLFFWKYAPWLLREVQKLWPRFLEGRTLSLPLPVGISFFTLQGIAYLLDLGRGEAKFISFGKYTLFKSFFPQLVAGPIVRVHQLMPQLEKLRTPRVDDILVGISLFALGFFKKLVIADNCALFVDIVFAKPTQMSRWSLIGGVLGYTVQIWADFSGYTDMGRGAARILGFQLPENFLAPYLSRSPSEFWRRWHITLSSWIRDYIYIPLGGNKGGQFRVAVVAITTMVISGLWHGANWTFLLWGVFHGLLLIAERLIKASPLAVFGKLMPRTSQVVSFVTTLIGISLGWLIFRSPSIEFLGSFLNGMLHGLNQSSQLTEPDHAFGMYVGLGMCITMHAGLYYDLAKKEFPFMHWIRRQYDFHSNWMAQKPIVPILLGLSYGIAIALTLAAGIFLRSTGESKPFIYFQF
jgi:alginate O-acetyltransferase complex protein AlgI